MLSSGAALATGGCSPGVWSALSGSKEMLRKSSEGDSGGDNTLTSSPVDGVEPPARGPGPATSSWAASAAASCCPVTALGPCMFWGMEGGTVRVSKPTRPLEVHEKYLSYRCIVLLVRARGCLHAQRA